MFYSYLAIDSNKKYSWKNFYNYLEIIINYFETLASLSKKINQIIDKCKKKLESNATIKRNILDIIIKRLNFSKAYKQQLITKKELEILALKRKDTIVKEVYN